MFRRSLRPASYLVALVLLAVIPAALAAQAGTATIAGVVKDGSGAPIPGAAVKVVNEATKAASDAYTDAQGAYRIEALAASPYRVEVALDGFETVARQVVLQAGEDTADWLAALV